MKRGKLIACLVFVFIVVFSFSLPCLCASWGEMHPNSSPQFKIPLNATFENGIDYSNYQAITTIIDNAYDIGLFGGAVPLFITMDIYTNGNPSPVYVHFANPTIPTSGGGKYDGVQVVFESSTNRLVARYYVGSSYSTLYLQTWFMTESGEFGRDIGSMSPYVQLSTSGKKVLAYYNNGTWEMGGELTSTLSVNVYSVGEVANETLTDIISVQEEVLEGVTIVPPPQYELNIGEIITAIPNGAKQIINNAFDMEIFGINVAGLLSTILVVVIVAFVVKWLTSR